MLPRPRSGGDRARRHGIGPCRYAFSDEVAEAAGIHNPPEFIAEGGALLDGLRRLGVAPDDIETVVLTHLHADHIGWIAPDGRSTFTSAKVLCSAADWSQPFVDPAPGEAEGRAGLERIAATGGLQLLQAGRHEIAAGVVAEVRRGHTPRHTVVQISAPATDAPDVYLVGDAVHHTDQLVDRGVTFLLERDPADALRVREELFAHAAGRGIALGMSHWRGLDFQTVDAAPSRSWRPA
jgi:glyoxylase-like metal-dependent hydrolase (beta-lactamase superfamily II)